jgi:hypothetical protein
MQFITNISTSEIAKIEVVEEYKSKFQNDFVVEDWNGFVKVFATRYIGMSFLNKVKRLNNVLI